MRPYYMVKRMRTVFFATPALAVPALHALSKTTTVVGVVCQPDRPAGRGLSLREPPVKLAAKQLGLEVHQPVKVKTGTLHEWLRERSPDVVVVLAYGRILPPPVLAVPRRGCLNLHASLLPKYRGAAPINWAIVHGETETGLSLMQMDEGCDTGPVLTRRSIPIGPEMTAGELAEQLAQLAVTVVREDLPRAVSGKLRAVPQDEDHASLAPLITKEHRRVDWSKSAPEIANLVRGMAPRPSAFTTLRGKQLKVLAARAVEDRVVGPAGRAELVPERRIVVRTGDGALQLTRAQLEGRKALDAADLINGRSIVAGELLGQ